MYVYKSNDKKTCVLQTNTRAVPKATLEQHAQTMHLQMNTL